MKKKINEKNNKKNIKKKLNLIEIKKIKFQNKIIKISLVIFLIMLFIGINYTFKMDNFFSKLNENKGENNFSLNSFSSINERYLLKKSIKKTNKIINLNLEAKKSNILYRTKLVKMYSYNGMTPGPIIKAKVGDTLNVTLINHLNVPTTIHWHGLQIPNKMDGVPGVTQKSVKPNEKFNYKFKLNDAGIYWYHSHFNTAKQIGMGLYGILIVKSKNETLKFDKEQILVLDDLRLNRNGEISFFGSMMDTYMGGRYGNNYFINGQNKFNITAYKNSLLKIDLINPSNARIFKLAFKNNNFIVVGNGIGKIKKPYKTDSIILAPGERAEILLYLNKTNKNNNINILNLASRKPVIIGNINLISNNNNNNNNNNLSMNIFNKKKYFTNLIKKKLIENLPDWSDKLLLKPDIELNLYSKNTKDGFKWTINGNYYPEKPDIENLTLGKFYKVRYINRQRTIHPMHIHGQKFIILARNGIPVNHTMYRDMVLIFPGEIVDIGLIAQGKGSWVNHCHILEHAEAGMLGIINVK